VSLALGWDGGGATGRPRSRARPIILVLSVAAHALAAAAAIAYSFWHVEELSPPVVTVTFVSAAAAPLPPPPPPPLGGDGAAPKRHAVARPKVEARPKIPEVARPKIAPEPTVAPIEEPPKEVKEAPAVRAPDEAAGDASKSGAVIKGGVAGGAKGGVVGGTVGGTGTKPAPTNPAPLYPPQIGTQQKLSGPKPDFPSYLARAGARYLVLAKICVGVSGAVDSVTLLKRAQSTLDDNVVKTVKGWRFRPMTANNTPVPFCYVGQFDFKSE
jgi:protein TonB